MDNINQIQALTSLQTTLQQQLDAVAIALATLTNGYQSDVALATKQLQPQIDDLTKQVDTLTTENTDLSMQLQAATAVTDPVADPIQPAPLTP